MVVAHTLGSNGPEIEFLVLAGALLILGVVLFLQKTVKPSVPLFLVLGAIALGVGAFAFASDDEAATTTRSTEAELTIVAPSDGDEVPAGEPFTIEVRVDGGTLTAEAESDDPDAGHLHIFVDEELVGMPTSDAPEIELEPGEHEVVVEFTATDHSSYSPPVTDTIELTAR